MTNSTTAALKTPQPTKSQRRGLLHVPGGYDPCSALRRSVDIELMAFRVLHPDRVVVQPFRGQGPGGGGAQAGQPAGLRVDSLPASLDRVRPLATGVDVEVQPVLDRPGIWDDMEPDARPVALRVADPVRPVDQLLLRHPQPAVEVVPGSESSRRRRELIAQRGGPEPSQPVRVGTVDDQLKADRHRFPPQAARVATGILPDASRRGARASVTASRTAPWRSAPSVDARLGVDQAADLGFRAGAGEGNIALMTSAREISAAGLARWQPPSGPR